MYCFVGTFINAYLFTCPKIPRPCTEGLGVGILFVFVLPAGLIIGFIFGLVVTWYGYEIKGRKSVYMFIIAVLFFTFLPEVVQIVF
jgi:hypothetical protein